MPPAKTQTTKAKDDQPVLDDRDHQRGCPVVTGDSDRESPIEQYRMTRPATADQPAVEMVVTRCVQCGGETADPVE